MAKLSQLLVSCSLFVTIATAEGICEDLTISSNQYADLVEQQFEQNLPLDQVQTGVNFLKSLRGDTSGLSALFNNASMNQILENLEPDFLLNYGLGLAPFSGPSFFFFVLTLLICPFFFCARCCMANRCCKPKKALEEYSKCSRLCPLLFYFLFSVISVALALIGIMETSRFVSGMTGGYCTTGRMIVGVENLITEVKEPVDTIISSTKDLSDFTKESFSDSEMIDSTVDTLLNNLQQFGFFLGNSSLPGDHATTYFADKANEVHDMVSDLRGSLNPVVGDLDSTRTSALDTLESVESNLDSATEPLAMLSESSSMVSNLTHGLKEIEPDLQMILSQTKNGAYVFYSTVFFGFLAGVLSVLLYFTPLSSIGRRFMTCSWSLTYIFTMFLFLLGGLLITVSFVVADTCEVLNIGSNSTSSVIGFFMEAGPAAEAFDSCVGENPKPLMETIGKDASVNTTEIEEVFGSDALNAEMDVTELNDFVDEVATMTIFDLGFPGTLVSDALTNLNAQTDETYVELNCTPSDLCDVDCMKGSGSTCAPTADNPTPDASTLDTLRSAVVTAIHEKMETETLLMNMKTDVAALNQTASDLSGYVSHLKTDVASMESQVNNIVTLLDDLSSAGNCSFVGTELRNLHRNICAESIGGLTTMSLSMFFVAVMGIPMIILSVVINIRFFGTGASGFVQPTVFVTEDK